MCQPKIKVDLYLLVGAAFFFSFFNLNERETHKRLQNSYRVSIYPSSSSPVVTAYGAIVDFQTQEIDIGIILLPKQQILPGFHQFLHAHLDGGVQLSDMVPRGQTKKLPCAPPPRPRPSLLHPYMVLPCASVSLPPPVPPRLDDCSYEIKEPHVNRNSKLELKRRSSDCEIL